MSWFAQLGVAFAALLAGLVALVRSRVARKVLLEAIKHPTKETVLFPEAEHKPNPNGGQENKQQEHQPS